MRTKVDLLEIKCQWTAAVGAISRAGSKLSDLAADAGGGVGGGGVQADEFDVAIPWGWQSVEEAAL
jgi:hypothetical protein